jgi:hypothetical protein
VCLWTCSHGSRFLPLRQIVARRPHKDRSLAHGKTNSAIAVSGMQADALIPGEPLTRIACANCRQAEHDLPDPIRRGHGSQLRSALQALNLGEAVAMPDARSGVLAYSAAQRVATSMTRKEPSTPVVRSMAERAMNLSRENEGWLNRQPVREPATPPTAPSWTSLSVSCETVSSVVAWRANSLTAVAKPSAILQTGFQRVRCRRPT